MSTDSVSLQQQIRDVFLKNVYNETHAIMYNGGPECAKASTFEFKTSMSLRLIPWYIAGMYVFYKFVKTTDERKSIKPHPNLLEKLMGITCFICYLIQIYLKINSQTLIFILNPCHVITLVWGIVLTCEYSKTTQILFLYGLSNIFNPWIGMVFAENDELESTLEIYSYWVQHVVAAIIAPLICLFGGRFAHKIYSNPLTIIVGFQMFSLYMRLFLTPMSALTWANLNHTLCGIDNDPWRTHFNLGEYYFFWAEFYLSLAAMTSTSITIWLARCLRPSVFDQNEVLEIKAHKNKSE